MERFKIDMEKKDRNARHPTPEMTVKKVTMIQLTEQSLTPYTNLIEAPRSLMHYAKIGSGTTYLLMLCPQI